MSNREKFHKWAYFGGMGAGKGWYQLMFFIAPDELYTILSAINCFLLITNGRVPVTYHSTSKEAYRSYYEKYCETVQASQSITRQVTNPLRISITHLDTEVESQPIKDGQYKFLHTSEPVINLIPLPISYDTYRLRVNVNSSHEAIFGLVLSFPKVVFYAQNGFEQPNSTDHLRNREIYDNIVAEVVAISQSCVFQDEKQIYRTRIRLTDKGKAFALHHHFLLQHRISLRLSKKKSSV